MHTDVNKTLIDLAADLTRSYAASAQQLAPDQAVGYFKEVLAGLQETEASASPETFQPVATQEDEVALQPAPARAEPQPAVPIEESVNDDYLICLEDGKKFKMLKRHLRTSHNMTPEEYRAKWGLPEDYPMVAPSYVRWKSRYAKSTGLGTHERQKRNRRRKDNHLKVAA